MSDLDTRTDPTILPYEGDTDTTSRRHIVRPEENGQRYDLTGQDIVDLARLNRTEVIALCGIRFIPERDPMAVPPCDACIDIAAQIMRNERY